MADAFTPNRNIIQPQVGGDSGTWGGLLNNGAFGQLDTILGTTQPITITVADITLTTSQWNNCAIKLTGALTDNRSLILPYQVGSATVAVGGLFVVDNETSGAFNITAKTVAAGSTGVVVPQGVRTWLYSDGTNVYYADDSRVQLLTGSGNPTGSVAGTAGSINNPPSVYWDYTNAVLYFCITTGSAASAVWSTSQAQTLRGFNMPINLQLSCIHTGGNLLQISVKTLTNADPSLTSPVSVEFQTVSGGAPTGGATSVSITSALSMTTSATGATLGTANGVPFRIWFALFNNAGTAVLAMCNATTNTGVSPLAEYGVASTVSVSGAATTAGQWYTPNGTTLTNCAYRLIGYCEYSSGLTTAGTYITDPTATLLFGPGMKKPGDVVQVRYQTSTTSQALSGSLAATPMSLAITPSSNINPILARAAGGITAAGAGAGIAQLYRGGLIGPLSGTYSASVGPSVYMEYLDRPATTSLTTYTVYAANSTAGGSATWLGGPIALGASICLTEIMG